MGSGAECDKANVSHEDFDLLAKILFLDVLKRERGTAPSFGDVFASMEITEAYFDSHWTLQRVPLDMAFDFASGDAIASGTIDDVIFAGSRRFDLLRSYLRK